MGCTWSGCNPGNFASSSWSTSLCWFSYGWLVGWLVHLCWFSYVTIWCWYLNGKIPAAKVSLSSLSFISKLSKYYFSTANNIYPLSPLWKLDIFGTRRVIFLHQRSNLECNYCQKLGTGEQPFCSRWRIVLKELKKLSIHLFTCQHYLSMIF